VAAPTALALDPEGDPSLAESGWDE